jgi:hypothetical protein
LAAYLTVAIIHPHFPFRWVAVRAEVFSLTVELSQLYHTPWIDKLRQIPVIVLLLGQGFLWSDLVCYGVGIGVGKLAKTLTVRHFPCRPPRAV